MLAHVMAFCSPLSDLHFFKSGYRPVIFVRQFFFFFFFFCCSDFVRPCALSELINTSESSHLLWNPSNVLFSSVTAVSGSMAYVWYSLVFSISLLKFPLCSSILPIQVSFFLTITLNSLSGKLLIFVSLKFFSEVGFFFSFRLEHVLLFILLDSLCCIR